MRVRESHGRLNISKIVTKLYVTAKRPCQQIKKRIAMSEKRLGSGKNVTVKRTSAVQTKLDYYVIRRQM
jgi:hypothetical protein